MGKRKQEPEHPGIDDGHHPSKRVRTGAASLIQHDAVESGLWSRHFTIDAADSPPAGKTSAEAKAAIKLANRLSKMERRKQRKEENPLQDPLSIEQETEVSAQPRKENKIRLTKEQMLRLAWTSPRGVGGRMLDIDPVFSEDEDYLFVAFKDFVNIYSTTTSLLVRQVHTSHHHRISAFAMSCTDSNRFYIATEDGNIQLWDISTGKEVHYWITDFPIYALQTSKLVESNDSQDLVYAVTRKRKRPWKLRAYRLKVDGEPGSGYTGGMTLRTSKEQITSFKVLEQGRLIVATSGSVLSLGYANPPIQLPLSDLSYTWRDVECPEWISCFDVRTVAPDADLKCLKGGEDSRICRTAIVVGGLKGSVHVYDDLLRQLILTEKRSDKASNIDLTSRKQHWHRNAVLAVKWSRDGNYIISGGLETTLLIWQQEIGSLNTLPHLGAPLEAIVVSPSGSSYAIRLADNSAMIISTADLKPNFSVAGLQLPSYDNFKPQLPFLSSVDVPDENTSQPQRLRFPSVSGPSGLLCAVPAATSSRIPFALQQHASFLQTVDLASACQLSRQALTRTKATDLNTGPESNLIQEPDVVLMQISHDGQWLATIDEWKPPKRDVTALSFSDVQAGEQQERQREIFLKFWTWDEDSRTWALATRIDDPHAAHIGVAHGKNRVLDLVADPSTNRFATIGEDGNVRVWKSSVRQRHGSTIKDRQGHGLVDWHCTSTIPLGPATISAQTYTGAKLAYSADGSCLAASLHSASPYTIHLIDTYTETATTGPYGPLTGMLYGLGIIERYLIILSDQLHVWDLVRQELSHTYTLKPQDNPSKTQPQTRHLAVDPVRGTFAIALPYIDPVPGQQQTNDHSQIIIFQSADPAPIHTFITQHPVSTLTTLYDRPGFIVIDSAAQIQTIVPQRGTPRRAMALPTPPATPLRGLENIYGHPGRLNDAALDAAQKPVAPGGVSKSPPALVSTEPRVGDDGGGDDDAVVVTPEALAKVLDCGPAYAMPTVTELFERVARLYAGAGAGAGVSRG
ncbi:MAG: hypothetical protein Q9223_005696 [Gallowayella weberi]